MFKKVENTSREQVTSDCSYWVNEGKIYYDADHIRGADFETFVYDGEFAKDKKYCYYGPIRLRDADVATFEVLNFAFAKDKQFVYTSGGKAGATRVKEADVATFEVLDDGKVISWYLKNGDVEYVDEGYAKDKFNVYYQNGFSPKVVKNADLDTFISLNDGMFGKDVNHVFAYGKILKKANIATWHKIIDIAGVNYSKDDKRIFYLNREMKEADYDTFEVIYPNCPYSPHQLAKDKNHFYKNDGIETLDGLKDWGVAEYFET